MPSPTPKPPWVAFGVTHPLGLPRPIDSGNFFGADGRYFALNQMPIPSGCLAHFDRAVYRPHARKVVTILRRTNCDWSGAAIIDGPPRYCLLRGGAPATVPVELGPLLPEPPRVSLEEVLCYFDPPQGEALPLQLLDVLSLVSEDLGPDRFATATAAHPWVAQFMR